MMAKKVLLVENLSHCESGAGIESFEMVISRLSVLSQKFYRANALGVCWCLCLCVRGGIFVFAECLGRA